MGDELDVGDWSAILGVRPSARPVTPRVPYPRMFDQDRWEQWWAKMYRESGDLDVE